MLPFLCWIYTTLARYTYTLLCVVESAADLVFDRGDSTRGTPVNVVREAVLVLRCVEFLEEVAVFARETSGDVVSITAADTHVVLDKLL